MDLPVRLPVAAVNSQLVAATFREVAKFLVYFQNQKQSLRESQLQLQYLLQLLSLELSLMQSRMQLLMLVRTQQSLQLSTKASSMLLIHVTWLV